MASAANSQVWWLFSYGLEMPFGQPDILSLWSVTEIAQTAEMSMLKNTSAFRAKGCYLHLIVESCIVVPPFSCKMELPAMLRKRQRIGHKGLAKEGI